MCELKCEHILLALADEVPMIVCAHAVVVTAMEVVVQVDVVVTVRMAVVILVLWQ